MGEVHLKQKLPVRLHFVLIYGVCVVSMAELKLPLEYLIVVVDVLRGRINWK